MKKLKSKKMMLLLSVFLVLMLCVGAANAASDADTDDSSSEGNVLTSTNDVEKITASTDAFEDSGLLGDAGSSDNGTFTDLKSYIDENKGYKKVVTLNKDYVWDNETDSYYLDNYMYLGTFVEIDGQGHTIDGNNKNNIFNIIGTDVVLKILNSLIPVLQ